MKIAIVHEWLDTYAGSERVLEQMLIAFPEADLFALCDFLPENERGFLNGRVPKTSFIQRMPFARKRFRNYLQLMPIAVEQFDLAGYDVVLSSSHAVAKGVITGPGQKHISYVHSPMRYAWDLQGQYLREAGLTRGLKSIYTRWLLHKMRLWDQASAARPDVLLANSSYIAERIGKAWGRSAQVLHPPVDLDGFPMQREKAGHFLVASRQVPYKRVELVVEAFKGMPDLTLKVVGDGPSGPRVRAAAAGAQNVQVLGRVSRGELVGLTQSARAFVFAAEEDFGIAMVEAQAAGTPLIAYGKGGAVDIVRPGETGLLFPEQSVASIQAAVRAFLAGPPLSPEACRDNASRFSEQGFRKALQEMVGT
ncbi:glycosyltransferase [Rhodovarius lipocyclicus]|jgi:glycosyltransferase involved in cell wall biosynthesis|uniref:glycosyltransferase n=1 Tax=Rhodovarius lipocyclicus TaxID=268410 RepID=UPI0013584562|nr:glycosyltransferase [Rhodovarius lipocyclicus]